MIKIQKNVPLSKHSNYKIGGQARYFFEAKSIKDLKEAVVWARENKQKIFILGGGTNLLFSDAGFKGLVLKIDIQHLTANGLRIRVGAGVLMPDLLKFAIKQSFSGLEWAGGLPGTLGGAIRGNAGAFRGEIKDNIESVESFNIQTLKVKTYSDKSCQFGYRTSFFKKKDGEFIVTGAVLKLKKGNPKAIKFAIQDKIDFRRAKHPLEYPNTGSTFKNVDVKKFPKASLVQVRHVIKPDPFPVIPTAYLISEAGLKGLKRGKAMVSPKHPNFIVNLGGAKASHVKAVIKAVKAGVKRKFGITLEVEVQIVS
ncbi:MAG: UDP-N-acetylmuramate dehydrogenase [Candidatus Liptonbacteria bacterium]|nr:UDP-N-acetylmuramate dehydrogenase [Candidatus Liptonbacteria bacterium]